LQLPSASADDRRIPLAATLGFSCVQPPVALHDRSLSEEQSAQDRTWLVDTFYSGHSVALHSDHDTQFIGLVELSGGIVFY
jgi:hypothetical protein